MLDLGKHKVKSFEQYKRSNEQNYVEIHIDSSEDFFDNYIKTNEGYIEELDFKVEGYIHYGFLVIENNAFEYHVFEDSVYIYASYGTIIDSYHKLDFSSNRLYIIGNFGANLSFEELDTEVDPEHPYRFLPQQSYSDAKYSDFIKIYSYIDSSICKIEDNVVYLKAFYDNHDGEMKLTDDYFVTISEVNGRPTLSRSNMLNEL